MKISFRIDLPRLSQTDRIEHNRKHGNLASFCDYNKQRGIIILFCRCKQAEGEEIFPDIDASKRRGKKYSQISMQANGEGRNIPLYRLKQAERGEIFPDIETSKRRGKKYSQISKQASGGGRNIPRYRNKQTEGYGLLPDANSICRIKTVPALTVCTI